MRVWGKSMMLAATSAIQWIGSFGVKRDIVGSDIVIVVALAIHAGEGITLALTSKADWPIPMHTLLMIWGGHASAAAALLGSVVLGIVGQWVERVPRLLRIVLLIPQWTLLLMTAGGSVAASVSGAYVNFAPPSGLGIFWDQAQRVLMPIMYFYAAWARVKQQ